MKTLCQVTALVMLVLTSATAQSDFNALRLTPSQPEPSAKVSLTYNPNGTKLANSSTIESTVFFLNKEDEIVAMDVPMKKEGNQWQGSFTVPANAYALAFDFTNGDRLRDNNEEKGYATYLYKNGNVMPGSRAALGSWYNGGAYVAEIDPDRDRAKTLFQEEFKNNPSLKRQFTRQYLLTFNRRSATDKAAMEGEANELAKNTDLTADEISALGYTYELIGKKAESEKYQQLLKTKFPDAGDALYMAYRRFGAAKTIAAKKAILDSVRVRFANSRDFSSFDGYLTGDMARTYIKAGKMAEASKLATTPAEMAALMQAYNSIAWDYAEKDSNLVQSAELSKQATEWAKAQIGMPRTPTDLKIVSDAALNRQRKRIYAQFADTYGFILTKQGKFTEALTYLNDAVTNNQYSDPSYNERYAQALAKAGATSELVTFGQKVIREGNSNEKLEDLFKAAYSKEKGAAGFDAELSSLKKDAATKLKAELTNKLINRAAPDFSLMDLNGKTVSLASLKGKVVVVDFWATWCGPCIQSFPGMQKAVTKYAQSPDVAFLFVNTWQSETDKKKNAADFIAKKNYGFQVVLDDEDNVVTSYKVSGIPTKFIIDKNGSIRFKSIGYNGDPNKTADEISQMVDILREMPAKPVAAAKTGE